MLGGPRSGGLSRAAGPWASGWEWPWGCSAGLPALKKTHPKTQHDMSLASLRRSGVRPSDKEVKESYITLGGL